MVTPKGRVYTRGAVYNKESTSFLDLPDATRSETLATLGPPDYENHEAGVLLYLRETAFSWHLSMPFGDTYMTSNPKTNGLFIAYNPSGRILLHGFFPMGDGTPDQECAKWLTANKQAK